MLRKAATLVTGIHLLSGCTLVSGRLTPEQSAAICGIARDKVQSGHPEIDPESKMALAGRPTSFRYYRLGGDYYYYSIAWNLPSNRLARVFGQGKITVLENATVEIRALRDRKPLIEGK